MIEKLKTNFMHECPQIQYPIHSIVINSYRIHYNSNTQFNKEIFNKKNFLLDNF